VDRAIGVDLGGTKILAGVIDRGGAVERSIERPTPTGSEEELVAALEDVVADLSGSTPVGALGFAVPSTIDQRRGVATSSVNIPIQNLALRDLMHERFGLPAGIENDANAAALAEWTLGAGRGSTDMVMLTLGTGVGGGVVTGGKLFRGWAELGHVVLEFDGPPCFGTCTGRGHVESLVSGSAANRVAEEVLGPGADAHQLVSRAREGEKDALDAMTKIGRYLGAAIGSFVNVFDAELFVIGGGFGSAAGDLIVGPAGEIVDREVLSPARGHVRIVPAKLGPEAGLVGAGLIAFEALDSPLPAAAA
jgi:glucokinase